MVNKLKSLVIDTGALVKMLPLWDHSEELITVDDVKREIKDNQTRRAVEAYPVEIQYRQPLPESIKFINEFTKKTGDYAVLSATDVKILALTYEIEVETHGDEHLRKEPMKRIVNTQTQLPLHQLETVEEQADEPMDESKTDNTANDDDGEWCTVKTKKKKYDNSDGASTVASSVRRKKDYMEKYPLPGFYIPKEDNDGHALLSSASSKSMESSNSNSELMLVKESLLQAAESHLSHHSYIAGFAPHHKLEGLFYTLIKSICPSFSSVVENNTKTTSRWCELVEAGIDWRDCLISLNLRSLFVLCETLECFSQVGTLTESSYPSLLRWLKHMSSFDSESLIINASKVNSLFGEDLTPESVGEVGWKFLQTLDNLAVEQDLGDDEDGEEEEEEDEDDDGGWITPDNIGNIAKGLPLNYKKTIFDQDSDEESESSVACITGDFAMQNVLHHIGLKVLGIDTKVIKQTRTYTLRCHACFKLCPDMSKIFCPRCGNKTLKRVAITLNPDGSQNIYISRRPINIRGMKYNLPRPRGGQHAVMPLLTADQRFPPQWPKKAKNTIGVMDPDYIARSSPFATNDTHSRASMHGYIRGESRGFKGQFMHAKIWKPKRKPMRKK